MAEGQTLRSQAGAGLPVRKADLGEHQRQLRRKVVRGNYRCRQPHRRCHRPRGLLRRAQPNRRFAALLRGPGRRRGPRRRGRAGRAELRARRAGVRPGSHAGPGPRPRGGAPGPGPEPGRRPGILHVHEPNTGAPGQGRPTQAPVCRADGLADRRTPVRRPAADRDLRRARRQRRGRVGGPDQRLGQLGRVPGGPAPARRLLPQVRGQRRPRAGAVDAGALGEDTRRGAGPQGARPGHLAGVLHIGRQRVQVRGRHQPEVDAFCRPLRQPGLRPVVRGRRARQGSDLPPGRRPRRHLLA
mmetsp:Transcript_102062/g.289029  ORF Transcript_102062/g.289029 Transcript_102062/m.289029 type:complete len:299 (+) Transcript_102062:1190-2086(+)